MINFIAKGNAGKAVKCFNTLIDNPDAELRRLSMCSMHKQLSQWQNSFNQMQPANFNDIAFAQEMWLSGLDRLFLTISSNKR